MTKAKAKKEETTTPEPAVTEIRSEPAVTETKPAPAEPKTNSAPWGKLSPTARGAMVDPDTGIRYTANPVPMDGMPKKGSWFDCQEKAGLLVIVKGPAK